MKKIKLTQGQFAIVDDSDFNELSRFNWYAKWDKKTKSFYAGRSTRRSDGKWSSITIHRQILRAKRGFQVDHINHDTLDNRRRNLRVVNNTQNQYNQKISKRNTSGFKGVSWHKSIKKWQACIRKNKSLEFIGYFDNPKEAALAYNVSAKKLFGEHAFLNIVSC